jgi:Fic family protein
MESLGLSLQQEAELQTLAADVLKSGEIEGESFDSGQVRSSITRHLAMDTGVVKPAGSNVDGIVEVMLDATRRYEQPLTADRLFAWHVSLFRKAAAWRDDSTGTVHEAPEAKRVPAEMGAFLEWFNEPAGIDPVLKAALAHLWVLTIHPFDEGNGWIARALTDMALARSENSARRFYSMSAQIQEELNEYYETLE